MAITTLDLTKTISGTLPRANGGSDMVLLSTTTPTAARDIDISIASGYDNYFVVGRGIDVNTSDNEIDLYFTADNFSTTDSAVRSEREYHRLDAGSQTSDGAVASGYVNVATNQGTDATDCTDFEFMLFGATISSRSVGYSFNGHSVYGHSGDTHHYRYAWGGRSQTTSVIDGFRLRTNSGTTFLATGSIKIYGLK
jgi:hypothetical protein